ncbi:BON domain-containing protein [Arthrobacter sp. CAN_C5]|uniref:BON domain-containing protein n=1 Tax=Arthrobacter sp. CAN_C5 TaxID=2760706 RepID=UPI001AE2E6A7
MKNRSSGTPPGAFTSRENILLPPLTLPQSSQNEVSISTPSVHFGSSGDIDSAATQRVVLSAVRRAVGCLEITVSVKDGTASLTGIVDSPQDKSRAGFACWCSPAIRAVQNDLRIEPPC